MQPLTSTSGAGSPAQCRGSGSQSQHRVSTRRPSTNARGSISQMTRRKSEAGAQGRSGSFFTRTAGDDLPHATKKDMASKLAQLEQQFTVTPQRMRMIVDAFIDVLDRGLAVKEGNDVPMIPTYVFGYPTGHEKGPFLAVDLGGTNLRVCHVELEGEGRFEVTQAKVRISEEQKQDSAEELFDFCAEELGKFVDAFYTDEDGNWLLEEGRKLPVGFTFSYPCSQERIDHGVLIRWTKGWGVKGAENVDCAALFKKSLEKLNVPCELVALINDTTGTLVASSYVDTNTKIGVIFGTGCNAAYMERAENIPKLAHLNLPPDELMAINCEWGAFDSSTHEHLPRTPYDAIVDETSNKPNEQAFEKMIAGLYLGEIFRLVMCEMIDEGILFLGQETYKVEKPYVFDTAFLSLIESDVTDELLTVTGLFAHFFALDTTISERQFFKRLAQLIGTRSARLSACGVAALVTKGGYLEEGCGVATDGSLYNKYPGFPQRLEAALVDIFGEKGRGIRTSHAEDGSGVGAAIIASMTAARRAAHKYDQV